jgi:tetratricopeptide (TPR) repeat protein
VTNKFKISLPIEKRILLHLLDYTNQKNSYEVEKTITQAGIAVAIGIRLEHVSRAVKHMIKNQLVYSRTGHVRGELRQKKAYFLTPEGLNYAREIKRDFNDRKILIRTFDDELKEIKFVEINNFLRFKISPLDAYNYSNKNDDNIIELKEVIKDSKFIDIPDKIKSNDLLSEESKHKLIVSSNIPEIGSFVGREKEIKIINNALKTNSKFIVIQGIAGIGKTTLVAKILEDLKTKTNLFWYQFEVWSSIKHVLKSMSDFLNQLGKVGLFNYFKSDKGFDLSEVMDILSSELDGLKAIFVFDDFQRCDKHTMEFFSSLKNTHGNIQLPRFIMTSRTKQRFYDQRDITLKKIVTEIILEGLDKKSSKELVNIENLENTDFNRIYDILNGHPVGLKLLDNLSEITYQKDFYEFIEDQIFNELSEEEKELMAVACVFRNPVNSDALFMDGNIANFDTLTNLEQKFMIIKNQMGHYNMQDFLMELYSKRLSPTQKKSIHNHAAGYYYGKDDDVCVMEHIYHLLSAEENLKAAECIIEFGDRLISHGYLDLFDFLNYFDNKNIPIELAKEISILKGDVLIKIGEWDRALQHFESELKILDSINEKANMAEIYNKMGKIYGQIGEIDKNIKYNKESLKLYKEQEKKKEMAAIYNDLGINYRKRGDFKESRKMFQKSLKIFTEIDENNAVSLINYNLGKLYDCMNNHKTAINYYKFGFESSEKNNFQYGLALGNKLLGEHYFNRNDSSSSIRYLNQSIDQFSKIKLTKIIIKIYCKLGEIFDSQNDFEKSVEYYKKALYSLEKKILKKRIFRSGDGQNGFSLDNDTLNLDEQSQFFDGHSFNDEKKMVMKVFERIGNIYRKFEKYDDAIIYHTKQLEIASEIKDEFGLATSNINIGIDYQKSKIYDKSIYTYENALKILQSLNDRIGLLTVHRNLGRVYNLNKDPKNAIIHLNTSLDISKNIQYDLGTGLAYREIGKILLRAGERKKGDIYLTKARRLLNENLNK